ncbi:MAG TPA: PBP1A family penicillin-binding protein [bacterium]|nr:PBP1A family penicillin-binding protein [bacterium]
MGKKPTGGAGPAKRPVKKAAAGPARKPAKRAPKKKLGGGPSCFMIAAGFIVTLIVFIITMAFVVVGVVAKYTRELPELQQIVMPDVKKTSIVYASGGEVLAELYEENREYAPLYEIPDSVKLAFIATEDERFFSHRGLDLKGLVRVGTNFITSFGRKRPGASTITQQLARNTYLTQELKMESSLSDKITRKIKEILLSITIEKKYSKEEILEQYLNLIYMGNGAHGVKTASRIYFGKRMEDVTLAEAAMLAATIKAPTIYNPYKHPERVVRRKNAILGNMRRLHFITEQEYNNSVAEDIKLAKRTGPGYENYRAPWFVTYLLEQLQDPNGPYPMTATQIYRGGFRIYTTLDMKTQNYADEAVAHGFELASKRGKQGCNMTQGALLAMRPQTGEILAMVGGKDYKQSKFNRAWQALRQPGSSFKLFVYATALKKGFSMESKISDTSICYKPDGYNLLKMYCPGNYDNKYHGTMTLHRALVMSRNIPAVKIGRMVGEKNVAETAREMGITTNMYIGPSLSLGTAEVTILDMAVAYSTVANNGFRNTPIAIKRIETHDGRVVYQHRIKTGVKVLGDNEIARLVPSLKGVINESGGTGGRARIDRPAAGKTGTTSDYRDAWFCGFVPQMTTIVWVGNDNNSPLRDLVGGKPTGAGITGGVLPAPVWAYFMKKALKNEPVRDFVLPDVSPLKGIQLDSAARASGTTYLDFLDSKESSGKTSKPSSDRNLEPEFFEFEEREKNRQRGGGGLLLEPEVVSPDDSQDNLF